MNVVTASPVGKQEDHKLGLYSKDYASMATTTERSKPQQPDNVIGTKAGHGLCSIKKINNDNSRS